VLLPGLGAAPQIAHSRTGVPIALTPSSRPAGEPPGDPSPGDPPREGLAFVEAMERAVMAHDRAAAERYLAPDLVYTVGARPPLHGLDALFAYLEAQRRVARWEGHTLRGAWPVPEGLVVEVVSHFTRVADGRRISFPCVDIYRLRGERIADWRVFADMSPFSTAFDAPADRGGPRPDAPAGASVAARA
jgi:limonene-1,2-epoxide hydrolase